MRQILIIIVFFVFFYFSNSVRPDFDEAGYSHFNNWYNTPAYCSGINDLTNLVFCPSDTWAYGFQLSYPYGWGLVNINLDCRGQIFDHTNYEWASNTSVNVNYPNSALASLGFGGWSFGNTGTSYCKNGNQEGDWIRGYELKMWCTADPPGALGVVEMKVMCSFWNDYTLSLPTTQSTAAWTAGFSHCLTGYVACGYQMTEINSAGTGRNVAVVDIAFKCCKICEINEGFYYTVTNICDFCDINCLTCKGSSIFCTSCSYPYILSASNTCTTPITSTIETKELFSTFNLASGWTTSSTAGLSLQASCGQFNFIGGYNLLSSSDWLQKSIVGLSAHWIIKITFQYFKIGDYNNANIFQVYVDGVLKSTTFYNQISSPIYYGYGADCGGGNKLMHSKKIEIYYSHTSSSVVVRMQISSTIGFWAINRFKIDTFNCDSSCQTCSGIASFQCTSCFAGAYLTTISTCVTTCPSPQWGDSTTGNCVLTCPGSYYKYSPTRICVQVCPDNYYKNLNNMMCENPCTGNQFGEAISGLCQNPCPNGYWGDIVTFMCLPCDFNCGTCSGSSSFCLYCKYSWLLGTPTCTDPIYAHRIENNILNSPTLTHLDVSNSGWSLLNEEIINDATTCGNYKLAGGDGVLGAGAFMAKSYSSLIPHIQVRLEFYFMKIGNWNNNNFIVLADSSTISTFTFNPSTDSSAYKVCGPLSYSCALRQIDVLFSHSSTSLNILLTTDLTLDATQSSWGIYNLSLTLILCDSSCKTCLLPNNADACMSCNSGFYLQNIVGPSKCQPTCPAHTFSDSLLNICGICDSSCSGCSNYGTNFCTSCYSGSFLNIDHTCVTICSEGYYPDSITNQCLPCDQSCSFCVTSGASQCLSCKTNFYFQSTIIPTFCISSCPLHSYLNTTNNTCLPCYLTCLTCSGPSAMECIICLPYPSYLFLISSAPSQCVCPVGYYFDSSEVSCQICDESCKSCSGMGTADCHTCNNSLYLQSANGPNYCKIDCKEGFYQYSWNRTCLNCDDSCKTCKYLGLNNCLTCPDGLFLQVPPGPSYCRSSCLSGFYQDNSTNECKICDISCVECINGSNTGCFSCSNNYYFETYNVSNNISLGKCVLKNTIVPSLRNGSTSLSYIMKFSSNYSYVYSFYSNKTTISIEGIENSSYTFKITQILETDIWIIDFTVNFSIINYPLMCVNLNPPHEILSNFSLKLSNYTLYNRMQYYYYLKSSIINIINVTKTITNDLNSISSNSYFANNIFAISSSYIFQTMIVMDMIKFLRYLDIKYPENVLVIFQASFPIGDLIPNIYLPVDEKEDKMPKIFQDYSISPYIFNNAGNNLIETMCYWFMGVIALVFARFFKSSQNKYVKVSIFLISMIFIWNYSLSYFLSNYISIVFFTFLAYRFPTSSNSLGIFNLFFSIILGILLFLLYPFLLFQIIKMRRDKNEKKTKVIPSIKEANDLALVLNLKSPMGTNNSREINKYSDDLILDSLDVLPSPIQSQDEVNNALKNIDNLSTSIKKFGNSPLAVYKTHIINYFNKISQFISLFTQSPSTTTNRTQLPSPTMIKTIKCVNTRWSFSQKIMELSEKSPSPRIDQAKEIKLQKLKELRHYGCLFESFKHNSRWQSYFVLLSLIRDVIYSLLITLSYENPFSGLIMCIILENSYILSLLIIRPFKEKTELLQNLFNECCFLSAISFAFYMAYMEKYSIIDEEFKIKLGWGIVFSNLLLLAAFVIRMLVEWLKIFYELIKELFRKIKRKLSNNKVQDINENKKADKGILEKIIEMENFFR